MLSDESKALLPPGWWRPAKENSYEQKQSKALREKEEAAWKGVTLLASEKARKHLVATNSLPHKSIPWPKEFVHTKELDSLKDEKHQHSKMLYKILKGDMPTAVNRGADVIGVILSLINGIDYMESEEVKHVLSHGVLPLLVDNNIRTSELLIRYSLEISGVKIDATPTRKSDAIGATSLDIPMLRVHLDKLKAEKKVAEATAKAKPVSARATTSSSSSSSFSKKLGSGGDTAAKPSGAGGWNKRGGGRGSTRGGTRGGSRGGRGGGRARGGGRGNGSASKSEKDI